MSNVIIDKQKIDVLANAISNKSGEPVTMTLDEMVEAVDGIEAGGGEPNLQAKTYTVDSAGTATVTADNGYDGLSSVQVNVPSAEPWVGYANMGFYTESNQRKWRFRPMVEFSEGEQVGWMDEDMFGSYYTRNAIPSNTTITPTTSAQTIGGANYMMEGAVTVAAMPSGTEGTPTATKGTVSNHSISVTPSVTNTAGYISGGTKTGTAVSVSASELVSGTYSVTSSGTKDVTNYASASVPALTLPSGESISPVGTSKATLQPHTDTSYLNIPTGYNDTAQYYTLAPMLLDSKTITTNGVYVANDESLHGYNVVTVNVSGGGSGTMTVGTKTTTLSAAASSISFTNLSGNPLAFVVTSSADQSSGSTKVVSVAYDGTSLHGMDVTTQAEADTGFTKSYSSGTLTITATSATFGANEYKLVYAYGGSSSDIHTADVQVGSGATSITFSGLSGRPLYFSCVFKSSFSTSSGYQRVIDVVNDGTNTYGHAFDSSAKAQTSWSYSYSGGSLTITSTGTNNGGYFHQPGFYQLTYAVDPNALTFQNKTGVTASTSSQTIYPDTGYDALESVQINAVSQTNLSAGNIKSGTTISISNGQSNLWSVTGTYTGGGGGGSSSIATATMTNSSNQATSIAFTLPSGRTPKAFFCRLTSTITRNSNSRYYYCFDMRWDGSATGGVAGNQFYMYSGQLSNITSGYSYSQSGTTFTLSSTGSRSASPGSFYNGDYELVYVY